MKSFTDALVAKQFKYRDTAVVQQKGISANVRNKKYRKAGIEFDIPYATYQPVGFA